MPMKLCRCGGFYRRGNYNFHTKSWTHKLYKVLKRRPTDEESLRFQINFVDEEHLIDDMCSNASTKLPGQIMIAINNINYVLILSI